MLSLCQADSYPLASPECQQWNEKDVRVIETEGTLALIVGDSPSDLQDVSVKGTTTTYDNIA